MQASRSVSDIVAALRANAGVADVALNAFRALYKITDQPSGVQAAVDAGTPELVVDAMRIHAGNAEVVQYGCRVLLNIENDPVGMQRAVDANAPATIVAAMRAHIDKSNVVHCGCLTLASIALGDSGHRAVVDAGALEVIVAALHAHAGDATVAHDGCFALAIITLFRSGQQAAVDAGACIAIIAALNAHAGDANVAREGCNALERITLLPPGVQSAYDAGALSAVATVMNAHTSIPSARDVMSRLFRWVCESGDEAKLHSCAENNFWAGPLIKTNGDNAICWCARNGHLAGVIFLRENGADIRARDDYAARWASQNGHRAIVDYLLTHGAELAVGELVLDGLPPDELAARLKSCKECWAARPHRLVCPRGAAAQISHNEPHECGICMRYPDCCEPGFTGGPHFDGNDCAECRPFWQKEWIAFRCGHVCHLQCAMGWAASKTRDARADDNLDDAPSVVCPHGRCVEMHRASDAPLSEGLVRVKSVELCANDDSASLGSESALASAHSEAHPLTLCGGNSASTVLSHLDAEHSHGRGLLGFFSMAETRALRLVCKDFCDAVAAYPWADSFSHIRGPLALWRTCFPRALAANVACRRDLRESDLHYLRGCHTVDISHSPLLTDAAFEHLTHVRVLNMGGCSQVGITNAAFSHIQNVQVLNMGGCEQLSGAALAHLRCVRELSVALCSLNTQSFRRLPNPHILEALDVTGLANLTPDVLDLFPALKAVNATFSSLLRRVMELGIPPIMAQCLPSLPDPTAYSNRGRAAYTGALE